MFRIRFGGLGAALLALAIWGSPAQGADNKPLPKITSKTTLKWVGCGISKKAYMNALAALYEKKTGIHIQVSGGGATKGIREVSAGVADIGGSCRFKLPNNPKEENAVLVPVAWDALVVITHPDNPVKNITIDQIRKLYLGQITNWKQLGGRDAPIHLYVRKGKISGVGLTIRQLVFANYNQDFTPKARRFRSSGPLEKGIQKDPDAVGITGISSARKRHVRILELDGKDPSYANIKAGKYLLYRPLYLAYNPKSPHLKEIKAFIRFADTPAGQKCMRDNGTVPYLSAINLVTKKLHQAIEANKRGL
ncbi:MAG TPA: phosphate ABC transporter substrate-binding protein [Gammaproteobacteria bacterium]|nr:phosphate ABC transporter substrate-binding protein [Gammaproteobacteria bacterium]